MNLKKVLLSTVGAGIVGNVLDYVVHGNILTAKYYSQIPALFKQNPPIQWFVIADFVAAFVLVWAWQKVRGSFGGGAKGGATGGFYAGVLVNFPAQIYLYLTLNGFPYELSWIFIVYGILWYTILGAVIGYLYEK